MELWLLCLNVLDQGRNEELERTTLFIDSVNE